MSQGFEKTVILLGLSLQGTEKNVCVLQVIGKTAGFAIPVIVVLLVLVGFFAASSYDGGATSVMRP